MAATERQPGRRRTAASLVALLATLPLLHLVMPGQASAWAQDARGWNLDAIRAPEAWEVTRGAGAVVAVVDTGVALDHPALRDRFVRDHDGAVIGLDLVDGDGVPEDEHGHGTLVAGIIAASDAAVSGVAPSARLLPVRVLDAQGSGRSEDVGRGIRWAVDNGADVVNVSLEAVAPADGGGAAPGVPASAVDYAAQHGVVVVAAAGNRPGAAANYPTDTPIVLVGAVDEHDHLAGEATVGRLDGMVAPGATITSTWCRRTADGCDVDAAPYGQADGTSFAAPHVAGVAALLAATGADADRIHARLRAGAVDLGAPGPDPDHGVGRLDAAASLGMDDRQAAAATADAEVAPDGARASAPDDVASPADPSAGDPAADAGDAEPVTNAAPSEDELVADAADAVPVTTPAEGVPVAAPIAMSAPVSTPGNGGPGRWLRVLALVFVAGTMVCWSAAARTAP